VDARVLVVGSANADLVVTVARRPAAGETVLGTDLRVLPGGKGANTAVAAARLGARTALLCCVGTDGNGDLLLAALRGAGVDTALVRRVGEPTGIAHITLTPDGENAIVVAPGANSALTPAHVAELDLTGFAVLAASVEVPAPTVTAAVAAARAAGVRPVLNLSPVRRTLVADAVTLAALDPLVVNEHEAVELTGGTDPARLLELGPRTAVVTLGARGVAVAAGRTVRSLPAPRVTAVDTTGAGDAFTGALAAALADGADLTDAAAYAVRVAAHSVTGRGAQPSYPTAAELE